MPAIQCFMLEKSGYVKQALTRWAWVEGSLCPLNAGSPDGGHEAEAVVIERWDTVIADDDPRYPTHCACGYEFTPADERYINSRVIWQRPGGGSEEFILGDNAPAGAMFWADWRHSKGSIYHEQRGGGPHLHVVTPGGTWDLDAIASNGPGWEWHGTPPLVTARPSIICGDYHGWLTDGVLTEV